MIKTYGADAVRWFILSDSPPEKDVQWSNQGVNAAYKFLQKIYNLNTLIINRKEHKNSKDKEFEAIFSSYILKITDLINNFQLNVVVANIYEIYNFTNSYLEKDVSNKCLKRNIINLMKILIPFTPHLAHECLEQFGIDNFKDWPKIDKGVIASKKIKIAIQINGKTKEIIEVKENLSEKDLVKESKNNDKIIKILTNKKVLRIIYVKNKILNYLLK